MKIFRYIGGDRKITARHAPGIVLLFVILFATAARGDQIDDSLPPDSPQTVKASARQAIQSGLPQEDVVRFTRAMLQNKFDEQQVQLAHVLMIEAKNSDMPVQPLMNKAFEGMAKNIDPALIVGAMETVHSRNAFAYQRAALLSKDKSRTADLGRALSSALAAGLMNDDADKITHMLQQQTRSMTSEPAYSLSLECFNTARDVSRLGVSSQNATAMVVNALNNGFNHQEMRAMRSSFMTAARQSPPQELARSYSAAILAGKGFQEGPGGTGSDMGSSTAGPGGSGSGASGGDAGGGSGGSGGPGPGGGNSGGNQ